MLRSDDLFQLIKSLSKSEKRYIRIYAGRHVIGAKNKYMRLFDLLDRMSAYSEGALRKRAQKAGLGGQLSAGKNYLYNLILAAMRAYNSGAGIDARLNAMLEDADFLSARALHAQADRQLAKARKLAERHDKFPMLLELLRRQRESIASQADVQSDVEGLFDEEELMRRRHANLSAYQRLSARIFRLIRRRGALLVEGSKEELGELIADPLLQNEDLALSNSARLFYYSTRAAIAYFQQDKRNIYTYSRLQARLCEELVTDGVVSHERYLIVLHNLLHACLDLGKTEELREGLQHLRSLNLREEFSRTQAFMTHASLRSNVLIVGGSAAECRLFLKEFEAEFPRYASSINTEQRHLIALRIAALYFSIDDPQRALDWNNHLLHDSPAGIRKDTETMASTLSLMIHYELSHFDYLEHLIGAYQRRLAKEEHRNDFRLFLLRFCVQALKLPAGERQRLACAAYQDLRREFDPQTLVPDSNLEYICARQWLQNICGSSGPEAMARGGIEQVGGTREDG